MELPLPVVVIASIVAVLAGAAEVLHARRVRRLAPLAFGPARQPAWWARGAPALRALAFGALAWALLTLLVVEPRRYSGASGEAELVEDPQHIVLVLDVSPSMRLVDAGPQKKLSRMARARELLESFFSRIPLELYRVSVVAVYNGAKPVVVDTKDLEVVRNMLGDLPMHFAFPAGKTKLFTGLEEAARLAKPWNPRSTTVVLLSDGDTVPATGMPKMPASVRSTIVVGVGDPTVGKFIDGRNSRQDVPVLRQIAARLGGSFHNGNEYHLASDLIADATGLEAEEVWERLGEREYALLVAALSATLLAFLPLLLRLAGTRFRPGRTQKPEQDPAARADGVSGPSEGTERRRAAARTVRAPGGAGVS
ncbi:MAG: VWA domain-containing protein [Planctomycetes bacterium]|nr:VWA domain-containing protein [Planctomycetota bacterium]